jgi:hypothetical protein
MHRTAQIVQIQIEEGVGNMEEPEGAGLIEPPEPAASPFESPIAPPSSSKPWRHSKKRRWGKG